MHIFAEVTELIEAREIKNRNSELSQEWGAERSLMGGWRQEHQRMKKYEPIEEKLKA